MYVCMSVYIGIYNNIMNVFYCLPSGDGGSGYATLFSKLDEGARMGTTWARSEKDKLTKQRARMGTMPHLQGRTVSRKPLAHFGGSAAPVQESSVTPCSLGWLRKYSGKCSCKRAPFGYPSRSRPRKIPLLSTSTAG